MDDAEVYVRWIQFCSFANIIRVHSDPWNDRRPWHYGDEIEGIFRSLLKTRVAMVPTLASAAVQASLDATPLVQRLDFAWPAHPEATRLDQYLLVADTLVAPINPFPPPAPPGPQ